ncbi:TauD/TfdA dioxygenase family protein [Sphingomonas canadensis]|uniref:TauD/TfdA dioxygenase family protein n=1 Tax=Sphingomonas canadensis TaxID=1219257 RepID=A0ABW3HGA1_9SPHN|nr:TauD/TfdA family dioxygenase [Sphingomonas canadensis]MCW3838352.1 TauD/TfdA family dioxygenase [Sphingomonas canadensis]
MLSFPLEIGARAGGFGAAVRGIDLSRPLPRGVAEDIRAALAEHGVLWFADQPLTHAALEAFSLAIGPFGPNPFVHALPGHPGIVEVRRDPDERAVVFGGGWHSDWSFLPEPPAATLLHAKVVPPQGGDTLFCDTRRAFEALSPGFQALLAGLRGVHSAAGPYGSEGYFAKEQGRTGMRIVTGPEADGCHAHPLVPRHPVSGRPALFASPGYTVGIEGFAREEAAAILDFVFAHMTSERFVYRHRWEPDMLVIWDNRAVLHCATGGYDGHLRLMHRTVIAGGAPA